MSLSHIPVNQIDESSLRALIDFGAPESRSIEYKRTTYGNTHADYSEFLADVSSFANTTGGDLVLGVEAADGIPTAITPLMLSIDAETLRLEQIARGGLQPRIGNFAFHRVPIDPGGDVLVIRIPKSYNAPHRVTRQNSNRFWARSAAGKYEPDVNELRTLFNAGPQLDEKIRDFRVNRIAKIAGGHAPVRLMDRGILVIHIVPLSSFDSHTSFSLQGVLQNYNTFVPIASSSANDARINFDGVLKTSNADRQAIEHRAYVQLYRSGIVESVTSTLVAQKSETIFNLDDLIIREVIRSLKDLRAIGCNAPFALLISLIGVANARFSFERGRSVWFDNTGERLERDQYHPDGVALEEAPTTVEACAYAIRPIIDQIANAGGRAASPVFDGDGRYVPLDGNQMY